MFHRIIFFLAVALPLSAQQQVHPESPPLSPADSQALIHVRDGCTVELVAAEPLVQDPTAIAWGPDGRLWVAEMTDYPLGLGGKMDGNKAVTGKPLGRIRVLEDSNGDGQYDQSTLFAEDLPFPSGVMPWRDGILVTAAPDVLYLEDTDGDGQADKKEVLLNGFNEGNQQLRVNGLRWGLDNLVHCANGSHRAGYGGDVRMIKSTRSNQEIDIGSRDFRFDPDTGEFDPQSGPSQFGRVRDDWGNWFGNMNSYPLWQFALRDHYLRRNPHVSYPDPRKQFFLRSTHVFPAKQPQKRYHSFNQSGRFTSACSPAIYRDNLLFPEDPATHAFTCEPFHNLVQHNRLVPRGASFVAERDPAEAQVDFFASKDRWCRPVMVRTGPDGALWVVDMYRYIIEHPQFLTPEGRTELEPHYRSGNEYGRIYRIYPTGQKPLRARSLDKLTTEGLVAALDTPNGPQRDLAHQLLLWRNEESAAAPLAKLATQSPNPLARLHALCALDGLDALPPETLLGALSDSHPGIRRHALRLTETRYDSLAFTRELQKSIATDKDPSVRLQLALSSGHWPPDAGGQVLGGLASTRSDDPFFKAAILSSLSEANLETAMNVLLFLNRDNDEAGRMAGEFFALSIAFDKRDLTFTALDQLLQPGEGGTWATWQRNLLSGLLNSLEQKGQSLAQLAANAAAPAPSVLKRIESLLLDARTTTLDDSAPESRRLGALRLMARQPGETARLADIEALAGILVPRTPLKLQLAAVNRLGALTDKNVPALLLKNWPTHGVTVRTEILKVLQTRVDRILALLDEVEAGTVPASDLDAATRQAFLLYPHGKIRARSEQLFAATADPNRQEILEEFKPALTLEGDPAAGEKIFTERCTICHLLGGTGFAIGPDLTSITDRKPASILNSIIDPSAAIDAKFMNYVATTNAGLTHTGYLASETGTNLTLQGPANAVSTVLRKDLKDLRSTGKSMMPEGLEAGLTTQQMADLLAYIDKQINPGESSNQ